MKRRGRPRHADDPSTFKQDEIIARTVSHLLMSGFSQDQVCECVGKAAAAVLGRVDHAQRGLGPDRVEQIYEAWMKRHGATAQRWRYSKRWLVQSRREPFKSLEQLALEMLARGGRLTEFNGTALVTDIYGERTEQLSEYMLNGDPELTPRAEAIKPKSRVEK
jgi:hypothetical protein